MAEIKMIFRKEPTIENYFQELEPISAAGYFRRQIIELVSDNEKEPKEVLFLCRIYQMAINALLKGQKFNGGDCEIAKICIAEEEKFRTLMTSTMAKICSNQELSAQMK